MSATKEWMDRVCAAYESYDGGVRESLLHALEVTGLPPEPELRLADAVAERVVADLVQLNSLTDEDLRLIREHVRPKDAGDAVEAAVLAERIRCARVAVYYGYDGAVAPILSGESVPEPKP